MAEFEDLVGAQFDTFSEGVGLLKYSAFGGDIDTATGAGWASFALDATAESSIGGRGALAFSAFGGDLSAGGWGELQFDGHGIANGVAPTTAYGAGHVAFNTTASYYYERYSEADVDFGFTAFGGDLTAGGWGVLNYRARGSQDIPEQNPGILLMTPGFLYATIGYDVISVLDSVSFSDVTSGALSWRFSDVLNLVEAATTSMNASSVLSDSISFTERNSVIGYLATTSALAFTHDAEATLYALLSAASQLAFTEEGVGELTAYGVVASMFVLAEQASANRQLSDEASSTLELNDTMIANIRALAAAVDTLSLSEDLDGTLYAFGAGSDSLELSDLTEGVLSGNLDAYDTLSFVGKLRLLGEEYTAYSVSLDNQAVSEYENYNFGSFGVHAGTAYGLGDAGIYKLEGPTDDGEAIVGRVRGPLNNLGTAFKKSIPAVYVGYTSTGKLGLKVITTDSSAGTKRVNLYSLSPIAKQSTSDGRFTPSKGLHSVYWQFELISEEGGQFELDEVTMWRMVLNRRK